MSAFTEAIRARLLAMPPSKRKRWRPSAGTRAWGYPLALEADLLRVIQRSLAPITKGIHKSLDVDLKDLTKPNTTRDSRLLLLDADAWEGSIGWGAAMRLLLRHQQELVEGGEGKDGLVSAVLRVGKGVDRFNRKEWEEIASLAIGDAFPQEDPWVVTTLQTWANENHDRITSLGTRYINKVNDTVVQATNEGWTARRVMQRLRDINQSMTVSKAKLIARDQVGRLNGQLTKGRMQQAGISMYRWSTSMDERVRGNPSGLYPDAIPSHWQMQGWVCRWDDNSVRSRDGVKWEPRPMSAPIATPGEEIQCRCTATPYFGKAIEDLVPGMQEIDF